MFWPKLNINLTPCLVFVSIWVRVVMFACWYVCFPIEICMFARWVLLCVVFFRLKCFDVDLVVFVCVMFMSSRFFNRQSPEQRHPQSSEQNQYRVWPLPEAGVNARVFKNGCVVVVPVDRVGLGWANSFLNCSQSPPFVEPPHAPVAVAVVVAVELFCSPELLPPET